MSQASPRQVRDIMQTEIIAVRRGTSVLELVQILDEESISGVPVLDEEGGVVGVVSRTDVIRLAARQAEIPVAEAFWEGVGREEEDAQDQDAYFLAPESAGMLFSGVGAFEGLPLEDLEVDEIMTPVAFTVDPGMTVPELAQFLVQGRIHRAIVVEDGRLVGLVTAFDVLRDVAGTPPS
jgi:CBS domain-containing protein